MINYDSPANEIFSQIETLHFDTPEDYKQYVNPNYDGHGHNGFVEII